MKTVKNVVYKCNNISHKYVVCKRSASLHRKRENTLYYVNYLTIIFTQIYSARLTKH